MAPTKGKWEIHDGGRFEATGDFGPSICASTGQDTCQPLFQFLGPADIEERKDNARLITEAPEMAELIRYIATELENEESDAYAIERAQQLLARIERTDLI